MESVTKIYGGINPFEYEEFKQFLSVDERAKLADNGPDSFKIAVTGVIGTYNRNENTLSLSVAHTPWSDDTVDDLVGKLGAMVGKADVTDQVQSVPLMTPIDPKTGLPVTPEPPGSSEGGPQTPDSAGDTQPVPEQAEASKTGDATSGEDAKLADGESQPPVEDKTGDVPVVTPKKKKGHGVE